MSSKVVGVFRGKAVWHYVENVKGRLEQACTGEPVGADRVKPLATLEGVPSGERCSSFVCQQIRKYREAKETGKAGG